MGLMDEALGTLLIGTWLNIMLFTFELVQLWTYVKRFPTDRYLIRALVIFMFLIDCMATCNFCAMVYLYTITHWGDPVFLAQQNNTIIVYSVSTGISLLFMHFFLIWRYVRLPKSKWKNFTIAPVLIGGALTSFVGDCIATWTVHHFTAFKDRPKLTTAASVWLTSAAVTDTFIAAALIWELSTMKSAFNSTQSLIRRVIVRTVVSGAFTAVIGLLTITTFYARKEANICIMFGFCIGRACTLTVLYNLNTRKSQAAPGTVSLSHGDSYNMSRTGPVHFTVETTVVHDTDIGPPSENRSVKDGRDFV